MYIYPSSVWEPANAATVHDMSWDQSCFVTGRKSVVSWIIHSLDSLHFAKVCVTLLFDLVCWCYENMDTGIWICNGLYMSLCNITVDI